ncbi:LLM class flavin-dependent oxidoreductase [Dactylosporangium sp. NPDC048998]|uniref:LLM class flavin-dependent oxidoreductase n=1 Tax=Dactylosporangium sp. NPDC048998 TaxID=3363976 RepID=UPI003721147D
MVDLGLVYDLRLPGADAQARARQYRTMLEQAAWADRHGFSRMAVREHHGADDGYLPSPLVAAGGVAAVTSTMTILLQALVVTLHDPVRLAEDLAVLDLMSAGRLVVVAAGGYADDEFAMFGVSAADRPRLVGRAVRVLRQAWTAEPFELDGRWVRVTPRPFRSPGPPLLLGGASEAAARRAARVADGFLPVRNRHYGAYQRAVADLGRTPPGPLPQAGPPFVYVAEDPERAWSRIAPYCLHESNAYGALARRSGVDTGYAEHATTGSLRASGAYPVLTPDEAVVLCEELGPGGQLTIPPLVGGMDPDLSWESLQLLADQVIPRVALTRVDPETYRHSPP